MGIERIFKWLAILSLTLCLAIAAGAGVARWTIATTNGFYTDPGVRAARTPGYARDRAVADSFWDRQRRPEAAAAR